MRQVPLTGMKTGEVGIVVALAGGRGLREKLDGLGIRIGKEVTKVGSVFTRGPVTVAIDGFQIAVGYGKALAVMVEVEG